MDKKSIIGIAVVAVLFLGFAYMNTKEQEKYQQEMARWQAYQDSLAAAAAVLTVMQLILGGGVGALVYILGPLAAWLMLRRSWSLLR